MVTKERISLLHMEYLIIVINFTFFCIFNIGTFELKQDEWYYYSVIRKEEEKILERWVDTPKKFL